MGLSEDQTQQGTISVHWKTDQENTQIKTQREIKEEKQAIQNLWVV